MSRTPRRLRSLAERGVFLIGWWPPGLCSVGPERQTPPWGKAWGAGSPHPPRLRSMVQAQCPILARETHLYERLSICPRSSFSVPFVSGSGQQR